MLVVMAVSRYNIGKPVWLAGMIYMYMYNTCIGAAVTSPKSWLKSTHFLHSTMIC